MGGGGGVHSVKPLSSPSAIATHTHTYLHADLDPLGLTLVAAAALSARTRGCWGVVLTDGVTGQGHVKQVLGYQRVSVKVTVRGV